MTRSSGSDIMNTRTSGGVLQIFKALELICRLAARFVYSCSRDQRLPHRLISFSTCLMSHRTLSWPITFLQLPIPRHRINHWRAWWTMHLVRASIGLESQLFKPYSLSTWCVACQWINSCPLTTPIPRPNRKAYSFRQFTLPFDCMPHNTIQTRRSFPLLASEKPNTRSTFVVVLISSSFWITLCAHNLNSQRLLNLHYLFTAWIDIYRSSNPSPRTSRHLTFPSSIEFKFSKMSTEKRSREQLGMAPWCLGYFPNKSTSESSIADVDIDTYQRAT